MGHKESYEEGKRRLIFDRDISLENRNLWKMFFEWEERKLKRTNNLYRLDEASYKTLNKYVCMFRNVNKWFNNKPWQNLTKEDIQRVYDDLEDGVIKNRFGKPYVDRKSYYTKIFKGKPFKLSGKAEITEEIFEFFRPIDNQEVSFIEFSDFKKLPTATKTVSQKLLLWLAWDIGENVGSLLKLEKRDFRRQVNPETNEPEYLVNLRKEILKRSRRARVEITNFIETTQLLDIVLENMEENDFLFNFGHRQALKFMAKCVKTAKVKCIPTGKNPTYKDLRNSMCCYLLKKGWRIEEANSRLGHAVNNLSMVSRYANYLALDKHKPKKKLSDNIMEENSKALVDAKKTIRLYDMRMKDQQDRIEVLENRGEQVNILIKEIMMMISDLQLHQKVNPADPSPVFMKS